MGADKEVCWWGTFDNSPRDPKHFVQVDWMRFIHGVNNLLTNEENPEEDTDYSDIGGFGSPKLLGRNIYDRVHKKLWAGCEQYPSFTVYTDNGRREAFIECYDREMEEIASRVFGELHP